MPGDAEDTLIVDAGAGDGGAGGDEGGGEGAAGDESGLTPEGQDEGGEGQGDRGDGKGADGKDVPGDKRYGSKDFKADYAKIKEVDPALAQRFQRAFWKVQNVDKLGTTQELTALKEAVEMHGGVEALTEMAEEIEAGRALEEGFKSGDPKVIDGWAADYPEGFKKLLLPAFDKLAQLDNAAWEEQAGTLSTKFLEKYGVFDAVAQIGTALKDNKVEDAVKLYNDLVSKVLRPMQGLASKRANDPLAGDRARLAEQEKTIQTEKEKIFYSGVRQTVNSQVTGMVNKALRTQLGTRRLTVEQGNRVRKAINSELAELANTAPGYSRQYTATLKAGDADRAVQFIVKNASKYVDKAVRNVLTERNLTGTAGGGAVKDKGAGGGNRDRGLQTIVGKPKVAEVDWTRSDKSQYILPHGQVFLKNGKAAKW